MPRALGVYAGLCLLALSTRGQTHNHVIIDAPEIEGLGAGEELDPCDIVFDTASGSPLASAGACLSAWRRQATRHTKVRFSRGDSSNLPAAESVTFAARGILLRTLGRRLADQAWVSSRPNITDPDTYRNLAEGARLATMAGAGSVCDVVGAVHAAANQDLTGAIVQAGVWLGGLALETAVAHEIHVQASGGAVGRRRIMLYDTFAGMSAPTAMDGEVIQQRFAQYASGDLDGMQNLFGAPFKDTQEWLWEQGGHYGENASPWAYAGLPLVRGVMSHAGLGEEWVTYVVGPVERTLHEVLPASIAVLHIDTDWYESTRAELLRLTPRLTEGGYLIVDDYFTHQGSRRATNEYMALYGRAYRRVTFQHWSLARHSAVRGVHGQLHPSELPHASPATSNCWFGYEQARTIAPADVSTFREGASWDASDLAGGWLSDAMPGTYNHTADAMSRCRRFPWQEEDALEEVRCVVFWEGARILTPSTPPPVWQVVDTSQLP